MLNGLLVERDAIFSEEGESERFFNSHPEESRLQQKHKSQSQDKRDDFEDSEQFANDSQQQDGEVIEEQAFYFGSTDEITH